MSTSRPSPDHLLSVVMDGQVIGDVQRTRGDRLRLRYADDLPETATPLSVAMSATETRHRENVLTPWLEGLLPDRPETLRQWRRWFAVTDQSPFSLLRHVGEDVAGGAQFVRPDRLDAVLDQGSNPGNNLTALDDEQVAERLRRAMADLPSALIGPGGGKFSLAGAQAKIALFRTPTGWADPSGPTPSTHILKPAIPGMADQELVELITMRTARALGLRAPETAIAEFGDQRALVVTRYDRAGHRDGTWTRVHQEDICQALALWPTRKYESQGGPSAAVVAGLIERVSTGPRGEDNREFASALLFNWLLCGTDAHARNYSLLLTGNSVRLAPLYDLNSHLAYSDGTDNHLSMSVAGTFEAAAITRRDWHRAAAALFVDPDWIEAELNRLGGQVMDALADAVRGIDVAASSSPVVRRLLDNAALWTRQRLGDAGIMAQ